MRKHGWQLPYHPLQVVLRVSFLFYIRFSSFQANSLNFGIFDFCCSHLKVVAVAVFLALGFAFYVFFAPFVGRQAFQYAVICIYTPLVSHFRCLVILHCRLLGYAYPAIHSGLQELRSILSVLVILLNADSISGRCSSTCLDIWIEWQSLSLGILFLSLGFLKFLS